MKTTFVSFKHIHKSLFVLNYVDFLILIHELQHFGLSCLNKYSLPPNKMGTILLFEFQFRGKQNPIFYTL